MRRTLSLVLSFLLLLSPLTAIGQESPEPHLYARQVTNGMSWEVEGFGTAIVRGSTITFITSSERVQFDLKNTSEWMTLIQNHPGILPLVRTISQIGEERLTATAGMTMFLGEEPFPGPIIGTEVETGGEPAGGEPPPADSFACKVAKWSLFAATLNLAARNITVITSCAGFLIPGAQVAAASVCGAAVLGYLAGLLTFELAVAGVDYLCVKPPPPEPVPPLPGPLPEVTPTPEDL